MLQNSNPKLIPLKISRKHCAELSTMLLVPFPTVIRIIGNKKRAQFSKLSIWYNDQNYPKVWKCPRVIILFPIVMKLKLLHDMWLLRNIPAKIEECSQTLRQVKNCFVRVCETRTHSHTPWLKYPLLNTDLFFEYNYKLVRCPFRWILLIWIGVMSLKLIVA